MTEKYAFFGGFSKITNNFWPFSENKFSGDWIEYSRWGFQIKRIFGNNETEENYNEFGKLTSKNIFNLSFPNGNNSEGIYLIRPNDYWYYLAVKNKPNNLLWASENGHGSHLRTNKLQDRKEGRPG